MFYTLSVCVCVCVCVCVMLPEMKAMMMMMIYRYIKQSNLPSSYAAGSVHRTDHIFVTTIILMLCSGAAAVACHRRI